MFPRGQIAAMFLAGAYRDRDHADVPRRLDEPACQPRPTVRMLIVELGGVPAAVLSPDAAR
jgi:hypothetical protein